jgi:5-formyltetrahydrofolate cyclo-ligase
MSDAPPKDTLRRRCWAALREAGAARFPGVEGRIPNFVGAEDAAARLADHPIWRSARHLKCNPDSPHRPVRHRALRDGKVVFMAVPRLRDPRPFLRLDPARLDPSTLWRASSASGAAELGEPVGLDALPIIDLVITGCVGATAEGARLGKGGGYSDLEFALLREHGLVDGETPVWTTLHPSQLLRDGEVPMEAHDVSLDRIVLPDRAIDCPRPFARPTGIDPEILSAEKRAAIPALARRDPP